MQIVDYVYQYCSWIKFFNVFMLYNREIGVYIKPIKMLREY